jgi:hypothetical protein
MNSIYKKVELIANVAIIAVAIVVGVVLVKSFFFARKSQSISNIAVGTKVALPGIQWATNGKTVVLALQEGCRFCAESGPFYQRLTQQAAAKGVKIVAVLPQPPAEGRQYLNSLGVPITDIRQASLSSLNVVGTPTLILVNDKGEVTAVWTGKLPTDKESEVLAKI